MFLLRRCNIRKRLQISYFFVSLLPILLVCVFLYLLFSRSMIRKTDVYQQQFVSQTAHMLYQDLTAITDASAQIAYSTSLQTMLTDLKNQGDWSFYSSYREAVKDCGRRLSSNEEILSAYFYQDAENRHELYSNFIYSTVYSHDFMQNVIDEAEQAAGQCVWTYIFSGNGANEQDMPVSFLLSRRVTNLSSGYVSGTLCLQIDAAFLHEACQTTATEQGKETLVMIFDSGKKLLASNGIDEASWASLRETVFLPQQSALEIGTATVDINEERYQAAWTSIGVEGWYVLSLSPYGYILSDVYTMGYWAVGIGVLCLLLAFLVSSCIAKSISIPLEQIVEYTHYIRKGDFSHDFSDDGEDEVHSLSVSFSLMTQELNRLILQIKESEKEKFQLEFKALQAQINPHFIANTLNTISYYADLCQNRNIQEITAALSHILLVTMGKGRIIVTIAQEIKYVQDYLLIQSYRYVNGYDITYQIDEEIQDYLIPKFILQPIVENALIHGVAPLRDRRGEITLRGFLAGKDIHLQVNDNGTGMTPEKLKEIFQSNEESEDRVNHIGVANVSRRLRLMYGEEYGVYAQSVPGVFTKFTIVLPAMKGGSQDENGLPH